MFLHYVLGFTDLQTTVDVDCAYIAEIVYSDNFAVYLDKIQFKLKNVSIYKM